MGSEFDADYPDRGVKIACRCTAGGNQIEGAFKDVCITEHCFDANFARNLTAAVIVLGSGLKFLARTDLPKLLTALIAVR